MGGRVRGARSEDCGRDSHSPASLACGQPAGSGADSNVFVAHATQGSNPGQVREVAATAFAAHRPPVESLWESSG